MTGAPGAGAETPPQSLVGKWAMTIDWESPRSWFWNRTGRVSAEAVVSINGRGLAMEVHSPGSDSTTRLADWSDREPGKPALHYLYDVVPRAGAFMASGAYSGAAILRYDSDHDELRGNYWTSVRTTGEFTLVRPGAMSMRVSLVKVGAKRRARMMKRAIATAIVVVLLGATLWFLLMPSGDEARTQVQRNVEFAVKQASATCLIDVSEEERRQIETGVASRLGRYAASGSAVTQRARRAVNETFTEAGQLKQGRQLQECMLRNTGYFLEALTPSKSVRAADAR